MKHLFATATILLLASLGQTSLAQNIITAERVISDETESLDVDLHTARCSSKGYGTAELKVSVPELADFAVFNHVNPGESAPCITAGRCMPGNEPNDLGAPGATPESVPVRVVRVEVRNADPAANTCTRRLEERVSTTIRGKQFSHLRFTELVPADAAACK